MRIPVEWLNDETIYNINNMDIILNKIRPHCSYVGTVVKYLNIPVSFDIETTSFYDHDEKCAIMYVWMIGIYGFVVMGRTWDEYIIAYNKLVSFFRTCGNKRHIIIYIHNASFDFQFLRKHHEFMRVFATGRYAPLYAVTNEGIEFRCSLRLSSFGLNKVAKNLRYHKIEKMTGDMDYRLIRHTKTPLTDKEKIYCSHDVKVVCAFIAECITDENENISTIPLTSTGYVRRDVRSACFSYYGYHKIISNLTLSPIAFKLSRDAFMGGYVHSNPVNTNCIIENVTSLDISSSYPTVMISEKYPMSAPTFITINKWSEFEYYIHNYNCIFRITIKDLKPRYHYDYYISASKCEKPIIGDYQLSNGRVVYADEITITITELDYDIIAYMYKINPNNISIHEFMYFEKEYLPTPFVKRIIKYYKDKTELADIPEYKADYDKAKRLLNGNYGMCATNPIRDEVYYINKEWSDPITPDIENAINKYNRNKTRFIYYPWAVYVTAYARHNIWSAIIECGDDHIYTDTDSEKCMNYEKHAPFFDKYNDDIQTKLKLACKVHGINANDIAPKNSEGKTKLLGIFKNEGTYEYFKTLGAKRYMYYIDNKIKMVCSGVSPKYAIEYLKEKYKNIMDIFNAFNSELKIPSQYTGRLIHTYIDEMRSGYITDYLGNTEKYCELSAVHLEPSDYNFSVSSEFINFINAIKGGLFEL